MNDQFAHLHVHNEYSFLDGFGKTDKWIEYASEIGLKHLALTNHSNVDGCIKWQLACKKAGIHSILGAEMYIVPNMLEKLKGDRRKHITLLCKNTTGWQNLLRLITQANVQGFYYRPRIDPQTLYDHLEGLIVLTACADSFLNMDNGETILREIADRTDVYLEAMPHKFQPNADLNQRLIALSKRYGLKLVATNDCHYIKAEHSELQEVLLAMQTKRKWKDPERWKFSVDGLYLRTFEELFEAFVDQGVYDDETILTAIENTLEVAEKCQLFVEKVEVRLPLVDVVKYHNLPESEQLTNLVMDGLDEKSKKYDYIAKDLDTYSSRIEEELGLIIELGFERYFLIVWEIIHWCKNNDIMVGPGRGSVGGSLVAYCLGITSVDPLPYKLVFSRFISPARIDLPDIDMDFEDIKRDRIRKHLEELYGVNNVIGLSTFLKMNGRTAVRDVGRVFDLPQGLVDAAAKSIVVRSGGDFRSSYTIEDAFNAFEDGIRFKQKYPKEAQIAMDLEGQIKAAGKHAAAMCVSADDLRSGKNACCVNRTNEIVCNWEKEDAEYMGLMKLDVLGLNALTVLHEAQKLIKARHGIEIDFEALPLDDQKVLDEFTSGNTVGVFQFSSKNMFKMCRDIKVEDFEQVIALNALNRPGCLRSGMVTEYEERKHGKKDVTYIHPYIEKITKDTYGLILYQEQVMHLMYDCGGLPWKTADAVRKVISKSKGEEQFTQFEKMFIDGCRDRDTLSEEDALHVFNELKYFGSYGFNKSHATEYALIAYWEMWLKVHYPHEYIAAILSYGPEGDRKVEHVAEAKRLGLKLKLPSVNVSDHRVWVIDDKGGIRIPLCDVKGIGPMTGNAIVNERNRGGLFKSFVEFETRLKARSANSRVKSILNAVHAFDFGDEKTQFTYEELEDLQPYFDFDFSDDPMFKYRNVIALIKKNIKFSNIKSVPMDRMTEQKYFFGQITTIKYGYKEKVKDSKDSWNATGLGGVYGYYKDDTDFAMLTFGPKIYQERKYRVEHCAGEWAIVLANSPYKNQNLYTEKVWYGDQILSGDLDGLELFLAEKTSLGVNPEMSVCHQCELRAECNAPVLPTPGQFNMMIIGEAPGREEDAAGIGFIGRSGDLLWDGTSGTAGLTRDYGLERELFHVTNVCKCYPRVTRTPKHTSIKACSVWLDEEIKQVKPFIILAFGNTCMKYFKNKDTGIMEQCRERGVEWNDKYRCWICWAPHPASVLYSSENAPLFNECIERFAVSVGILGFGAGHSE